MTTKFLSKDIWPEITKTVRNNKKPCFVAVAYFGAGSSSRLPLSMDSRLVVNASEGAVKSGQTCPKDLLKLIQRGVMVYSVPNLHAKVFIVGRMAYIGSNNVSNNSASMLMEAAIRTTDSSVVSSARKFVSDLCLDELTPEFLKQLDKLYQPPKIPGGNNTKGEMKGTSRRPELTRYLLAQLVLGDWSPREQELHDAGLPQAKKHRKHPRSWIMDDFPWYGKCPYVKGDSVFQVIDEGDGNVFVTNPGKVIHVMPKEQIGNKVVSFVYIERPERRRRRINTLAKAIGCKEKKLRRKGLIRDRSIVQKLLNTWAATL
jgi:hypothetical protein